ncbi:LURP-one-related/scramblase family protein [Pseudobutyrivibrio xylanivorans]|uniref:Uncharacterized protein YxjI n=1 Tax=Pseudobutyrivibrio xylanivorans DSM 14809 TaxID=1123012 RepID=A0A1M6G9N5_PSEXY|nr:LURP-one-related family protein [Pseudobutyrivibrio xylanivorans]SHJ06638.1 Uncharacterized protein YxjI [Pseudobutyrivibrio xylanivorans DSM 14809]
MGLFSKYREAGESVNYDNVERFGAPVRSLFTSTKVITLRHEITITDDNENVVYVARTQFPTIKDKTDIWDSNEQLVAHLEKQIFSFHERRFVTMADGTEFQLSNEIFHIIKDVTNIEGLGWRLKGNFVGLNFELYDANDEILAVISQKMISLHDKYCIDIYKSEHEKTIVAILIALQHMMADRRNSEAASASASSSS